MLWERLRKLELFADYTYTSWLHRITGMLLAKPTKNKRICLDTNHYLTVGTLYISSKIEIKNVFLHYSQRKQPTFGDATTGFPVK